MAIIKSGSLSATGEGATVVIKNGWLTLGGTWAGSVALQHDVRNNGTFVGATDETSTAIALTAATSCPIENAVALPTRLYFTRVSGTLEYTLRGDP